MAIKVKVELLGDKYFYTTTEKVVECPACKTEYKSRKLCLGCSKKQNEKVKTKKKVKERTGLITKDLKKYSCSCIFGSWFRFGKHWKEVHKTSTCKHFKWALKMIKIIYK